MHQVHRYAAEKFPTKVGASKPKSIFHSSPVWIGLGPDHTQLRSWAALPENGLEELPELVFDIEHLCEWPRQFVVYTAMLEKPSCGERPIALTATLKELIMMLRSYELVNFQDEFVHRARVPCELLCSVLCVQRLPLLRISRV